MEEKLNIRSPVIFDDSVVSYEVHAHQAYATSSFNNSDEIHIAIQNQDQCLLPSKSSIHVQGKITKADGVTVLEKTTFVNNAIAFLFSEIRYQLNAEVIDKCKNVGITTLMKGYPSFNVNQLKYLENAGWKFDENIIIDNKGNFDVLIPLSVIFGFAEDYDKIIANVKHELVFTRSNSDVNAIIQEGDVAEAFKITIEKLEWLMPSLKLSDEKRISLLKIIEKDSPITMSFRSWDLYEYPAVPRASKTVWTVKTSNQLEKPRYIILGFQTGRNNQLKANASHFDHCKITNIKLYLNSQSFPHGNLNLNIENNKYALLYDMFSKFQSSYYEKDSIETFISRKKFITDTPLIVIDCSKQNESMKYAPVDVRLEFESSEDFPANTSAFCLILHDRVVQYKPISGEVKRLV